MDACESSGIEGRDGPRRRRFVSAQDGVGATLVVAPFPAQVVVAGDHKGRPYSSLGPCSLVVAAQQQMSVRLCGGDRHLPRAGFGEDGSQRIEDDKTII